MAKSASVPYNPQDPRISHNFFLSPKIKEVNYQIFKYIYDFDENGAFYYLGTKGKKYSYINPHKLKIVNVFARSISKG